MQIVGLAKKVTIYIGESDKWKHKPLYMAILEMLKEEDCAGVTVTRAIAGFGANSRIYTASLVDLSADLPIVMEWVDSPQRVKRVMSRLKEMVGDGLITQQDIEIITYTHRNLRGISDEVPVHDVMSHEVHAVPPTTPLAQAVQLLLNKVYRTLPVVDENQRVIGILTDGDLLRKVGLLAISVHESLNQLELEAELVRLRESGQTVEDVMIPEPITISANTNVTTAINLMTKHRIKRLPVENEEGQLVGILSRVDILRAIAQPTTGELPRQTPPFSPHGVVGEMMTTQVPTVTISASLTEVVSLLVNHTQRRVMVVDQTDRVVGIITDGDLINRATPTERPGIWGILTQRFSLGQANKFQLQRRTAVDVMTSPVITVTARTSLVEALQLLLSHRIKRLPVVDEERRLVGMVGRSGILQVIEM